MMLRSYRIADPVRAGFAAWKCAKIKTIKKPARALFHHHRSTRMVSAFLRF
jgi:hypothetical protein